MTIKEILAKATTELQQMYLADGANLGVPQKERRLVEARLDAEVLLGFLLGWPREELLIHNDTKLTAKDLKKYEVLIARRLKHEPVAYITGKKEFYGLTFTVTKDVLIPRPETEMLVELALKEVQNLRKKYGSDFSIADIGTGAGNIICAIAKSLLLPLSDHPESPDHPEHFLPRFYAIDASTKVLALAKQNAKNLLLPQIVFLKGNLLEPIPEKPDLIVANLPYLPISDWQKAPLDVKNWEPKEALLGGDDGLNYIFELIDQIKTRFFPSPLTPKFPKYPKFPNLTLLLEFDPSQTKILSARAKKLFPQAKIEIFKDLAGFDRTAKITF